MTKRTQSAMYELTYEFEGSGGNIQYQTEQRVETEATAAAVDVELVSTGLSLRDETTAGSAIVEVAGDVDPDTVFASAISVRETDSLLDPMEAHELAEKADIAGAGKAYRFEVSKAPLVVGAATHGPGQTDTARFYAKQLFDTSKLTVLLSN